MFKPLRITFETYICLFARQSIGNQPYIQNYIEPKDGKLQYVNQAVVKYFERKVYNLKYDSWESQTRQAIENGQLWLVIDNIRKYPDNFGYKKGILGYYISFTVDIRQQVARKLHYVGISSAGFELISGKFVERIEGIVKNIPDVIPKNQLKPYIKRIMSTQLSQIDTIQLACGHQIHVVGLISYQNFIFAYGYKTEVTRRIQLSAWIDKAITIDMHTQYNNSDEIPYIDNFIEPKDGELIFKNNVVYKYFERKVYNLTGSWEQGTQYAIKHRQLFLIVNGVRIYPDNDGINRAPRGFFVSFSVVLDEFQAKQVHYVSITCISKEQTTDQNIYEYNANVKDLWTPNPIPPLQANAYLSKLIWQNLANVGYMKDNDNRIVKIDKCTGNGKNLIVHGHCVESSVKDNHDLDDQSNLVSSLTALADDPFVTTVESLSIVPKNVDQVTSKVLNLDTSSDLANSNEGYRQTLKRNFAEFCQTVDPDQLSHLLYENDVLSPSELRQMQTELSTIARNKIILFSVLDKDIRIFYILIGILKRHGSDCERDLAWKLDQEVARYHET